MKNYLLLEVPKFKSLILFALPIFGENLLQDLYGAVDLMIVGLFAHRKDVSALSKGSMTL